MPNEFNDKTKSIVADYFPNRTEIKALEGQFKGLEKAAKSSSEEIQRIEIKALEGQFKGLKKAAKSLKEPLQPSEDESKSK